ncbi:MAG: glycosyltransferase family 8 protein [Mesorhizobium sp.]|nr:glycosyltransferase family 8 protein [Mesorhizobium sp.]MBL8578655.1 glycosyltransferase family 8 protein [Mesorhizobium sp.]
MKPALVLACDENFTAFASIVAKQALDLASEKFPIIVLADNVSDESKHLARTVCPGIEFIDVAPLFENVRVRVHKHYTRVAYARLLVEDALSDFDQITYLDSDITILADIVPLLKQPLTVAPVAAAHDLPMLFAYRAMRRRPVSPGSPYFNSGVIVFDMKRLKAEGIFRKALQFAIEHPERCDFVDQDALNHVLDGRWQVLDWRWNTTSIFLDQLPAKPFIRHLNGNKPWAGNKWGIEPYIIDIWRDALRRSPWPERFMPAQEGPGPKRRPVRSMINLVSPGIKGQVTRLARNPGRIFSRIEPGALAKPLL